MNILAIETSSQACSVALSVSGMITEKHEILNNQHSEYLLSFINELFLNSAITKSELDLIAVGNGPGSFTGIRLGMGVAQGLAYGLGIPLIPISSLLTVAAQSTHGYILAAINARMSEVYWQCFERQEDSSLIATTSANLNKPCELALPEINGLWFGVGSGWDDYFDQLKGYLNQQNNCAKDILPKASVVVGLAQQQLKTQEIDSNKSVLPSYIRNNVTN